MKYEVEINNSRAIIDLDERDGRVLATIDGRRYDLEALTPEAGVFLLINDKAVYEARVGSTSHGPAEASAFTVEIKGQVFSVSMIDRKHRHASQEDAETGQQYLTAPMPGKVVRILAQKGEGVSAGQGVLVVEAMKMQNEVKSKGAGVVVDLRVKEGDTVTANQVLAVVE